MITDRNLKPGTLLKATYKGKEHLLEVIEIADESLVYRDVASNNRFKSPSAAAMAITGNNVNGWRFWSFAAEPAGKTANLSGMDDAERAEVNAEFAAQVANLEPEKPAKRRGRKPIHLISFLKGDHTRYWCSACQKGYPIEVGALLPAVCPAGHRDDDPELTSAPTTNSREEDLAMAASAAGEFNVSAM